MRASALLGLITKMCFLRAQMMQDVPHRTCFEQCETHNVEIRSFLVSSFTLVVLMASVDVDALCWLKQHCHCSATANVVPSPPLLLLLLPLMPIAEPLPLPLRLLPLQLLVVPQLYYY